MDFLRVQSEIIPVRPETLFTIGSFEVTNAIVLGIVLTLIIAIISILVRLTVTIRPTKFQNFIEMVVDGIVYLLEQITGNRKQAEKLLPLMGTIFVFFMLANLVTLIPGVSSFTYNGVPLFRGPTNDFNMTFSVALGIVLLSQIMSIKTFGVFGHLGKYFKFKELYLGFRKGFGAGMVAVIDFFIGLLDIVSELAKVFSLSLRLFGNMFAGEILIALLLGAFAFGLPSVWLAMNLLVGVVQAIVFGALSAAYYTMAVQEPQQEAV